MRLRFFVLLLTVAACAPPTVISPQASAIAIATVQLRSTMMTSSTFQAHRSQSTQPLLRSNGTKEKVEYTACAAHGKAQRKARRSDCGIAASPLSAPGNEALRQGEAVLRDIAGARVPDAILALVLDAMFDRINRELRTQYLLGYYPNPPPKPGSTRHVEVTVKSGDLVRYRKEYFTSAMPR